MEKLIEDDMFQALAEETNETTAKEFFGYIFYEYHFQPNELLDQLPDFYENLSVVLEDDWNIDSLKRFVDEQFVEYYKSKRIIF